MPRFPPEDALAEPPASDENRISVEATSIETEEARTARLRIKTRRRRYLEKHPSYLNSPSLELADPLLYDRMIRRFQTTAEREAAGKKAGWSGVMEADLMRSEAKMAALEHPDPNSPLVYRRDASGAITAVEQDEEDRPKNKQEGIDKWKYVMEQRFLRGEDGDFEYELVDGNDMYDDWDEETRRVQDEYFDKEAEQFVGDSEHRVGETGVQDY